MVFHESEAFHQFTSEFRGDTVIPTDPDYNQGIARWSLLAEREAGVITFPKNAGDVVLAIKFAVSQDLEVAIRGGGHNSSTASSTNGGIVIDLSKYLGTVKIDAENKVAYVGGGALWRDVDAEAIKYGLATVTGTVNQVYIMKVAFGVDADQEVGVGGFALGGGFGYLSGQYGTVVDNMLGAEVVIADGTILHCSATENKDLFYAIRGGGSNFGVVTTFEFRCYQQRPTAYNGTLMFPPEKLQTVFETLDKWENEGLDPKSFTLAACTAPPQGPAVVLAMFYNGSEEEGKVYYQRLFDLCPIMDTMAERPYIQVNEILNAMAAFGHNRYLCGSTRIHGSAKYIADTWANQMQHVHSQPELGFGFLGFIFMNMAVGSNDMAFDHNALRKPFMTQITWDGEKALVYDARKWARELIAITRKGADNPNEPGYLNWETEVLTSEDTVKKLFGDRYCLLQDIKAKYDPNMVFNKWFPIVPAEKTRFG